MKTARMLFGWRSLFFFSSLASSWAGRWGDEPCEEEDSSCVNVAMYDWTAEASVVRGIPTCTFESHDRIEKRDPVREFMRMPTSLRTPSMRGLSPSQSSAPIDPVRSMT